MKAHIGIRICAILFVLMFATSTQAQKKLTQGKVFFEISYPNLQPEMKHMEAQLPKDATLYFKEGKVRVEMPMLAGKTTTISDDKTLDVVVLMNMMGKKFAIKKSAEDIKKMEDELRLSGRLPEVKVLMTNEQKAISGYTCQKAWVTLTTNGNSDTNDCWFTELLPKISIANDKTFDAINGFMMEYIVQQNGVKMKMKVRKIFDEKIADTLFEIPQTYKVVTEEEIAKMLTEGQE